MDFSIRVGVASSNNGGSRGTSQVRLGSVLIWVGATLTWNREVVSVDIQSVQSQGSRVTDSLGLVSLSQFQAVLVRVSIVTNDVLAQLLSVPQSVENVSSKDFRVLRTGNSEVVRTQLGQPQSALERQWTDVGFVTVVLASPVTSPTILVTVLIWIVTTEQDSSGVGRDDTLKVTNNLTNWSVTEVLSVELGRVTVTESVELGVVGQTLGLLESLSQLVSFHRAARVVDVERSLPSVSPGGLDLDGGHIGGFLPQEASWGSRHSSSDGKNRRESH